MEKPRAAKTGSGPAVPASIDPELEERARRGDREARARLLTGVRGSLCAFCERYVGDAQQAEDAAHDVLARLAGEGPWPEGSFRAWTFRIARNRCLDLAKRRRDGREGAGTAFRSSVMPSPRTGPGTALARAERQQLMRAHLEALPPAQAEVLVLRYFDGLDRREIAEVLELPVSVVKSRLFEGRRKLRRLMTDEEE